jgi:hypothetical protein
VLKRVFDREKFKRLVHYIIAQAGPRDGFGATKLYKVLWFAEARQYMLTGKPIAGADYIREKFGPVPRLGMQIRDELAREGRIRQQKIPGDYGEWQFRSLTPPVMDGFSPDERATIDYWIRHIDGDHTAASISEESHDYAWQIAKMKEPLPLFAFLAERVHPPEGAQLERARTKAKELGLI